MTIPINILGQHIDITPALNDYVNKRLLKLERRGDNITHINVILKIDKLRQIATATLHVKGAEIHASAESPDMYTAIDGLVEKLDSQVKKHRENEVGH